MNKLSFTQKKLKVNDNNSDKMEGNKERINVQCHLSTITKQSLLPENWEHIFGFLSPEDFHTVINTCSDWNELLHYKKTSALFPMIFPLLLKHLPAKQNLRVYREVCKDWKYSVDQILDMCYGSEHEIPLGSTFNYNPDSYSNRFKILELLRKFEKKGSTPFLSRRAKINLGMLETNFLQLEKLLSKFGQNILELTITLPGETGITISKLVAVLTHTPNLKHLGLISLCSSNDNILIEENERLLNLELLPELQNLVSLGLWFGEGNPRNPIPMAFITKYGVQLEHFYVEEGVPYLDNMHRYGMDTNSYYPNIRRLSLTNCESEYLEVMSNRKWSLEKLTISQILCGDVYQFFEAIGKFQNSLVELNLNTHVIWDEGHDVPEDINEALNSEAFEIIKPLSNLRWLSINSTNLRETWFKVFIATMCQSVEQIGIHTDIRSNLDDEELEEDFGEADYKMIINNLPKLENIVVWESGSEKVMKTICKQDNFRM